MQAAVLRVKLTYLDRWTERRRRHAGRYERLFADAKLLDRIILPPTEAGNYHVFNQFTIRAQQRNALREYLSGKGKKGQGLSPFPPEIGGVNGAREDWREILLPLLQIDSTHGTKATHVPQSAGGKGRGRSEEKGGEVPL